MSTETKHHASATLQRGIAVGAGAGVVASIAMGAYAMVASLVKDTGFFTPLHHIATLFAEPADMMTSMMSADMGEGAWEIAAGTALLGLVIHMVTGAVYGAFFGVVAVLLRWTGVGLLALAGLVWGGIVFLVSAFVGLPLAAAVFGVDDLAEGPMAGMNPIADMAEMAGWGTFVVEHLVFGLVIGLLVAADVRKSSS